MQYLLLLWGDTEGEDALEAGERGAIVDEHIAFASGLRERGQHVVGAALERGSKLVRDDLVTDGPFTDTKEQLGGLYVIDVESEDEALEIARRVPRSPGLVVQVLPVAL
jgi:hypothetical protein